MAWWLQWGYQVTSTSASSNVTSTWLDFYSVFKKKNICLEGHVANSYALSDGED